MKGGAVFTIFVSLTSITIAYGNDAFVSKNCYENNLQNLDKRMPLSIDNLIALVEKYEREHSSINIEDFASGVIARYKEDGIVYNHESEQPWFQNEDRETDKQKILKKVISSNYQNLHYETFHPREECSLHFMTSHSTDIYPHSDIDFSDISRRRRSDDNSRSQSLPNDKEPSSHPIENGVLQSYWGPISAGTLLYGLSTKGSSSSNSIETILVGDDLEYMPSEMRKLSFSPLSYVATLAGDIAQMGIEEFDITGPATIQVSPAGKFAHHTACPRLYMQEDPDVSYITRAEILAGIDALLILKGLENSQARNLKLSEVLRMYYSELGLPGNQNYKACNRLQLYQELDREEIKVQARYFMYALVNEEPSLQQEMKANKDNFNAIEQIYGGMVNRVWKGMESFINNEARDYPECRSLSNKEVQGQAQVDLTVVLSDNTGSDMDKERKYISHVARKIGVSYDHSRLAVLDSRNRKWEDEVKIMSNYSNIADWGCNYTVEYQGSSGTVDLIKVLESLEKYYTDQDIAVRNDPNNAGNRNSQVLLWITPKSSGGDKQEFEKKFEKFALHYPEVDLLVVGRNKADFDFLYKDSEEDFFTPPSSDDSEDLEEFSDKLTNRMMKSPVTLKYAACDTSNATYDNYNEDSHVFNGYVSPNVTSFFKIGAREFHFSEKLTLKFDGTDLQICVSRTDRFPQEGNNDVECKDSGEEFDFKFPCGRYLKNCDDIYASIRIKNDGVSASCNDDECAYPNQVKYSLHHEGMICGTCGLLPAPLVLLALTIVHLVYN